MGEFLATLRKANGYTQQEVAEKLNISNRTLSSWETDRTVPDVLLLPAVADLYGVTVDELVRGERFPSEQIAVKEIEPQPNVLEDKYFIFNRNRTKFTAFGVLCSLIFFTGCIALLYTAAPMWVDVLLMAIGVIANAVIIILIFRHESLALHNPENSEKSYALALKQKTSLSLIINSLAYITGAIVLITCYYTSNMADGYYALRRIAEYYNAYYVLVECLCAIIGIALLLAGILNNVLYINCLGNAEQKSTVKLNVKLLKKICLFGIIPIALSFIPFITLNYVTVSEVEKIFFTANGVDEVYSNFQTLTLNSDKIKVDAKNEITVIPQGEYFLNFQSETYIECGSAIGIGFFTEKFYDLGNNFYAAYNGKDAAGIYHLKNGIAVEDIDSEKDFENYFVFYTTGERVYFTSSDGEELSAICVKYFGFEREYCSYIYNVSDKFVLDRDGEVYTYKGMNYYNYSPLGFYIFLGATVATVLTCTTIYLIKRKKQRYSF